jgi:hypothetical protein
MPRVKGAVGADGKAASFALMSGAATSALDKHDAATRRINLPFVIKISFFKQHPYFIKVIVPKNFSRISGQAKGKMPPYKLHGRPNYISKSHFKELESVVLLI